VGLFRVARHRGLDELRRAGRRPEDPTGLPGLGTDFARERAAPDDTAAAALERLSTEQALRMIAQLPKNQGEAVMLRVIIGLDAKQTAQVLGKRAGAVRIAAMRGLRGLSGFLSDAADVSTQPSVRDASAEPARHARSADTGGPARPTGWVDEVTP
jgi:RNA polymerase sigma-70 factor (ECF subfamily)